jgi:hypothetical protein
MKLQIALAETLRKLTQELLSIRLALKSHDDVVGEPHDDHVALGQHLTPTMDLQVEHVVEIDVCQERANAPALWCPLQSR